MSSHRSRMALVCTAPGLALLAAGHLAFASPYLGESQDASQSAAQSTTADATIDANSGDMIIDQPVVADALTRTLLRQGSSLVRAAGTLAPGPSGTWVFTLDQTADELATGVPNQKVRLYALPCMLLAEMRRLIELSDGLTVRFELTGDVYVYRGQNFIMPTFAPRVVSIDPGAASDETKAAVDPPDDGQRADQTGQATDASEQASDDRLDFELESIDQIIQEMEQQAGEVTSSRGSGGGDADSGLAARPASDGGRIVNRRGSITRDERGAWVFIFDADATGLSDPPATILPCLLLERIERYVQEQGGSAQVLLSGTLTQYERRRYVLPTIYRAPSNASLISR